MFIELTGSVLTEKIDPSVVRVAIEQAGAELFIIIDGPDEYAASASSTKQSNNSVIASRADGDSL
jgi:hypothetical protein